VSSSDLPKTLFIARGQGAAGWYRCALPAMALGIDWVGVAGEPPRLGLATGRTERPIRIDEFADYDVLVIQQPSGTAWTREIRRLQDRGVTVLFEIDDFVHAVRKMEDHDFGRHFSKEVVRTYELNMRAADGLICSTDFLAERYRTYNPRTWVCRNGIDLGRYALTRPARETVNIGWAGGTGHREALRPWLTVVAEMLREHPNTRFVAIGAPVAKELAEEFGPERSLQLPFTALESYPAAMTLLDVALAPAGRNNFFRGKSDLRWLEASALGIPLIADPMVYPEIEHGVTGFHASSADDVRSQLSALVADAELRRTIGESAKAHVTEHRTIQRTSQDWVAALQDAAGSVARAA
jgi:glycosyltransferase involved in cell wall biosynthesis